MGQQNAERMRAYRERERQRREALRGQHTTAEMAERIVEFTTERDRRWAQVVRLQQRVVQHENQIAGHPDATNKTTTGTDALVRLSRAERRWLEREQARRRLK